MDLSSMLNDGPPPQQTASRKNSPEMQRNSHPQSYPSGAAAANGPPATPGGYAMPVHHQTPLYATPSRDVHSTTGSIPSQSRGLTPLRTPSGTQHQSMSHAQQSPVAPPGGHQYRPYDNYTSQSSVPPVGGHQGSPGFYQPNGGPPPLQRQPTSSHSSTPQSHHSQVPQSLRHSPVTNLQQGQHHHQHSYPLAQQSTPSTPLGPPPLHYQRTSNHSQAEAHSPYLQRNFSGASNGVAAGSPAQHHPSIGNFVDSPSTYQRPSPQHTRRTSDYSNQVEREHSLSVSPKTKVPPRPPSLGSRHSSQDIYSVRSSMQQGGASATAATSQFPNVASQPQYANMAGEVARPPQLSAQTSMASSRAGENPIPLSQTSSMSPTMQQYQPQRMGMNQLLASTNSAATSNANNTMFQANGKSEQASHSSPDVKREPVAASPYSDTKTTDGSQPRQAMHVPWDNGNISRETMDTKSGVKRPAETAPSAEPPTKRSKRKYQERPIWARHSTKNPRANGGSVQNRSAPLAQQQPPPNNAVNTSQLTPQARSRPPPNGGMDAENPWVEDPPLDHDLINARSLLGQWEKTFEWNEPSSSISKYVQQWLFEHLDKYKAVGHDPRQGTLEIEGKIGTLFSKATDDRMRLPVTTATVVDPAHNHQYYFESEMGPQEHQQMNKYLNMATQKSLQPGRSQISYKHTYETDTFLPLSQAGVTALPQVIKQHAGQNRELRLRTTTETKTRTVTARIIKLKLADLHIYNPGESYDCRISINLEVNMNSPELDPELITTQPSGTQPPLPERRKDRLSYKHLAYQVDLTKVDVAGMPGSKYELEIEVDAKVLREQMALAVQGAANAYRDVVEGLLNDAVFLMRQQKG